MSIEKISYEHSMNIKMCLIFLKYARTFYTSYKKKKGDDHCGSCVWAVNRSSRVVWAKPNRIWAFRRRSVIFGFVRFGGKSETEPNPVRDEPYSRIHRGRALYVARQADSGGPHRPSPIPSDAGDSNPGELSLSCSLPRFMISFVITSTLMVCF